MCQAQARSSPCVTIVPKKRLRESRRSYLYFVLTLLNRLGPACWLWDYLRRSRTQGYFIPLSGGIDSCATAVIVHSMCRLVAEAAKCGGTLLVSFSMGLSFNGTLDRQVLSDAKRMTGEAEDSSYIPSDPREFANRIFHTCYMGTENSSAETRQRAKDLATAIGRQGAGFDCQVSVQTHYIPKLSCRP